jgi:redox-sensitive bicupin YhaK (pirin superfamily)
MIQIQKFADLGHADHGWLNARHHFSFASYYNPKRMNFGLLRVVNDDIVKAGFGFDTHPHRDMEIITYVREGAITHQDSLGNKGRTAAGDLQVMSAGSGVYHSEYNLENTDTVLYQIWIEPNQKNLTPRWDQKEFPKDPISDSLRILASNQKNQGLFINQDAMIYGGKLTQGTTVSQSIKHQAFILVSQGQFDINGSFVEKGDSAEVSNETQITITAKTDAEIIVIDIPAR